MGRSRGGSPSPRPGGGPGGKFLTFLLAKEEYGLEILKVREIIGFVPITPFPGAPPWIRGVVDLRGKVIPVMDLRLKFGLPQAEVADRTCIIVLLVDGTSMGIMVDSVSEVLDLPAASIEKAPPLGAADDSRFILGLGKTEKRVVILLDIARVLRDEQAAVPARVAEAALEPATPASG